MEHDRNPPVAILLDESASPPLSRQGSIRGRKMDTISDFLFELIKNGCSCGSMENGCSRIVAHCVESPDQAFYTAGISGRTPLHEACLRNACRHVVKALLAANPVAAMEPDQSGNTPLHLLFVDFSSLAISPDEVDETVEDLLAVNPSTIASIMNAEGSSPLHMACVAPESMIRATTLMRLVEANSVCAASSNNRCQTPLSLYCTRKQASVEIARILFEAHPRAINLIDNSGWTPLHHAAHATNTNLIRFLVECAPAAVKIRTHPAGRTALHLLCRQVPRDIHLPAVEALLRFAPEAVVSTDNVNSSTPVHVVCNGLRQRLSVIRRLVDTNPRSAAMTDVDGYTPLHHAVERGADVEIVRYLLSVYPPAASIITRKQDTPLHIACSSNASPESVKLLIEANTNALTMTNDYGFTPLHCVCRAYQPKAAIVESVVNACPESVALRTHGGETPVHLACSSGAFVSVLHILTRVQNNGMPPGTSVRMVAKPRMTNKVGNTPLHEACFRGVGISHIETLARSNPEWISIRNNAGYTPLQIVCKGGHLDERIVNTFARIRGPEVFSVVDSHGHTPLHSACREGTQVSAIQSLIQAYPEALHIKTSYGDTPLHLACLRGADVDIVCQVAEASSDGTSSITAAEKPNNSGYTPLKLAMLEFEKVCSGTGCCCVKNIYRSEQQERSFAVLKSLVKLVYYGTSREVLSDETPTSLVKACVSLHRHGLRLDPAFIRRAIHLHPEEVRLVDEEGNYPLHIEASIPVEKMSLLDGTLAGGGCCEGKCHSRMGVLAMLLESFPEATEARNASGEFPLGLMIRNGRLWDQSFALAVKKFPPALHWYKGMDDKLLPRILAIVSRDCGVETLFQLINSRPDAARHR